MRSRLTESAAIAKKNGLGPIKIAIGVGEPKIGPWERRRLAGQFRCHTPAGRQRSQVKFT
jgi:hypothetical protein